jgi:hypothetical protein
MNGSAVTLIGGAFVALIAAAGVIRDLVQARKGGVTLLGIVVSLAMVTSMIGWLMMWFTQEPIWSPVPRNCAAFASIELKGHVYRTCSYLVHRYEAGESMFFGGLLIFAACAGVHKLMERRR